MVNTLTNALEQTFEMPGTIIITALQKNHVPTPFTQPSNGINIGLIKQDKNELTKHTYY